MSDIPPPQEEQAQEQEKVDLSKLHKAPKNQMFIVDGKWDPSVFICQIHCSCGNLFTLRAKRTPNKVRRIRCSDCGFEVDLDSLIRDWRERRVSPPKGEPEVTIDHGSQKFREF